ncbi:MAG: hypothetical protein ACE5IY_19760, partial [bacterium]
NYRQNFVDVGALSGIKAYRKNIICLSSVAVSQSVEPFYQQAEAPSADTEGPYLCLSADGKGVRIYKSERSGADYKPETPKARRAKGEKPGTKKEAVVTAWFPPFPFFLSTDWH